MSGTSGTLLERDYTWSVAGELLSWQDTLSGAEETGTCTYDGIGALLGCTIAPPGSGGVSDAYAYEYDVLGNLIHESVMDGAGGRDAEQLYAGDRSLLAAASGYRAPVNAPISRLRTVAGTPEVAVDHGFDPRGSMVRQEWSVHPATATFAADEKGVASASGTPIDAARDFVWSGDGRLKGVAASLAGSMQTESRFWYGPDGGRVGKSTTDLGTGNTSMNQRFGDFFEWVDDGAGTESWTLPISLGDRILAQHDVELSSGQYTEEVRWVAGDHLGSASIITDELGDLWVGRKYEPYGRERAAWGPGAAEGENDLGSVERRFNGKQRELDAMGLAGTPYELEGYDYGARFYLPELGTWMSADSITPDNVGEFNAFQYVASNPLSYRDPTGNAAQAAVGFGIGALFELGRQLISGEDINLQRIGLRGLQGSALALWGPLYGGSSLLGASFHMGLGVAGSEVGVRLAMGDEVDLSTVTNSFTVGAAFTGGLGFLGKYHFELSARLRLLHADQRGALTVGPFGGAMGQVTLIAPNTYRSSAGLVYGPDPTFGNRILHVRAHGSANHSKPRHSVFLGGSGGALRTVDEAWLIRGAHTSHPQSGNWNYKVPMGRVVGTAGERSVLISVKPNTHEVVTAYPVH